MDDHDSLSHRGLLHASENALLLLLPKLDRERLSSACEPVQLSQGEILCEPGTRARHVFFPTQSFISLVSKVEGSGGVEVGMVGWEGMLGAHLALGITIAPLHALTQGPGAALRIRSADFLREFARSAALQRLLRRYVHVLMIQLATSAACQRFHQIDARLARWLLMSRDRAAADSFHLTQESLACMLGVRRVGVTSAAGALQRAGLIEYHRGDIRVVDGGGLEKAACSCYATDKRAYQAMLPPRAVKS